MPTQPLIAGPLRLYFNPSDGSLRNLTVNGADGLCAIYGAVRDQQWNTVVPIISDLHIARQEHSFCVTFTARCQSPDIDVTWTGAIRGEADGRLTFTFTGVTNINLSANRIGFCILHPQTCASMPCRLEQIDGAIQNLKFPALISPHQPFLDVRALTHPVGNGRWLEVRMEGTTFETEDQRNWTDASFKTYCTPLAEPFPRHFMRGETILQTITLRLISAETTPQNPHQLGMPTVVRIPQLGLGFSDSPLVPWPSQLSLDHLRLELRLETWASTLDSALTQNLVIENALEIAIIADAGDLHWLHLAGQRIRHAAVRVARVLVFSAGHKTTLVSDLVRVKRALDLPAPCFVGSEYFFAELNRGRPWADGAQGCAWSINPQVHAEDDHSVMETLAAQTETVRSAQALYPGRACAVGPITWRMRSNPNATSGSSELSVAAQLDPRHWLPFGAAWTLGSIAALAAGGADSATYFMACGPLGLIDPATGRVAPAFQVLADLGRERAATLTWITPQVLSLGLGLGEGQRRLIANLGAQSVTITLHGRLRVIDSAHSYDATAWHHQGTVVAGPTVLAGHSYACLD